MITSVAATQLAYVKSPDSSGWTAKSACQGVYGEHSTDRVGAIRFGTLRQNDWGTQQIRRIALKITYAKGGSNREKTIGLYIGAKDMIGGTGRSMIGAALGDFRTNGNAYGSTRTVYFSDTENPAVFANLKIWLTSDSKNTLVVYRHEPTNSRWSNNYMSITAVTMSIDHEPAGSGGRLSVDTVDAGGEIALTIEPLAVPGTITHTVQWTLGDAASGVQDLGSALTASFTVPTDWLMQMPNDVDGGALCLLTTMVDGVFSATRALPFVVHVPDAMQPTFVVNVRPARTGGGYWRYLGGARIEALDTVPSLGASVASTSIIGSENVFVGDTFVTTENFAEFGEHTYTVTVTDSRGRSAAKTVAIDVHDLAAPVIESFSVRRYGSYVDDQGQTVYRDDLSGAHVWVTVSARIDVAGGNNVPTAYIEYEPDAAAVRMLTLPPRADLAWPEDSPTIALADDRTIITAQIPLNAAYTFRLHVDDLHSGIIASARVEPSWTTMHIAGSGYGVAFGGYSSATEERPELRSYWPIVGADGYAVDVCAKSEALNISNPNFARYSESAQLQPTISRVGAQVYLDGLLRSTNTAPMDVTPVLIAKLPKWAWPRFRVSMIQQGSSRAIFWLVVESTGDVCMSRYRVVDKYLPAYEGNQFHLTARWIAADAYR